MLRSLPSTSAARIRLLAKFVEKDYEKLEQVVKFRREFASKVSIVDGEIGQERAAAAPLEQEERADEWFSRRLDAGLFSLQVKNKKDFIFPATEILTLIPDMCFFIFFLDSGRYPSMARS